MSKFMKILRPFVNLALIILTVVAIFHDRYDMATLNLLLLHMDDMRNKRTL